MQSRLQELGGASGLCVQVWRSTDLRPVHEESDAKTLEISRRKRIKCRDRGLRKAFKYTMFGFNYLRIGTP